MLFQKIEQLITKKGITAHIIAASTETGMTVTIIPKGRNIFPPIITSGKAGEIDAAVITNLERAINAAGELMTNAETYADKVKEATAEKPAGKQKNAGKKTGGKPNVAESQPSLLDEQEETEETGDTTGSGGEEAGEPEVKETKAGRPAAAKPTEEELNTALTQSGFPEVKETMPESPSQEKPPVDGLSIPPAPQLPNEPEQPTPEPKPEQTPELAEIVSASPEPTQESGSGEEFSDQPSLF